MSTYRAIYFRDQLPLHPIENGDRFVTSLIVEKGLPTEAYDVSRKGDFYLVNHPEFPAPIEVHASGVLCAHLAAAAGTK